MKWQVLFGAWFLEEGLPSTPPLPFRAKGYRISGSQTVIRGKGWQCGPRRAPDETGEAAGIATVDRDRVYKVMMIIVTIMIAKTVI